MSSIKITVKVVPGSSKTALAGELNGMLKIKVAAPPEKGKANKALIKFLANKLGIKTNDITITAGQTGSVKQIQIENIDSSLFGEKLDLL